jgi:hypothetical protein
MERFPSDSLDRKIDEALASDIVARIAAAKEELAGQMLEHGLKSADGWKIQEELRDTETGTQWVFRPVHLRRDAPDLHFSVILDHAGRAK